MVGPKDVSETSLMSVGDLIELAFGEAYTNEVNFKIIEAILLILARSLCLLQRFVEVKVPKAQVVASITKISITEVKVSARQDISQEGNKRLAFDTSTSKAKDAKIKFTETQNYKSDKESSIQTRRRISKTAEHTFKNTSVEEPIQYKTAEHTFKNTSVEEPIKYKSAKTQNDGEPNKQSSKQITIRMSEAASEIFEPSGENKGTYSKFSSDRSGRRRSRLIDPSRTSEVHQEKILIVGRALENITSSMSVSKHNKSVSDIHLKHTAKVAPQSLVTKDQFDELLDLVYSLQKHLARKELSNADTKLLDDLYKNVTFADPIAVLQLSARLEVVEKAVDDMMKLIQDLANSKAPFKITDDLEDTIKKEKGTALKKGTKTIKLDIKLALSTIAEEVNKSVITKDSKLTPEDHIKFMKEDTEDIETFSSISKTSGTSKGAEDTSTKKRQSISESVLVILPSATSVVPSEFQARMLVAADTATDSETDVVESSEEYFHKFITREDMEKDVEMFKQQLLKEATQIVEGSFARAMTVTKTAVAKVNDVAPLLNKLKMQENKIELLERSAADYAERINAMDVELSSKITQTQEELFSMQFDLDVKLENLMELLAHQESDTKGISELQNGITSSLRDITVALPKQTFLSTTHANFRLDVSDLWEILEEINLIKTDRTEAEEAINSKVGRAVLNNITTNGQFEAVIEFVEKQLVSFCHFMNKQEVLWQADIDNLQKKIDVRATEFQVKVLFGDIDEHITRLGKRLDSMLDLVEYKPNEPLIITKALTTNEPCLCCKKPAKEDKVELANTGTKSEKLDATDKNPKSETDNHEKKCYKGERARFCHKHYCRNSLNKWAEDSPLFSSIDVKAITKLDGDSEEVYRRDSARLKSVIERQMTDFMIKPCKTCNAEKQDSAPPSISSQIHKFRWHSNSDDSKTWTDLYDIYLDLRGSRMNSKDLRRLTMESSNYLSSI